jgi:hypothetical protein
LLLFASSRAPFARGWTPASITFVALLVTYLCIPPNCGVPKYNLAQELNQPAPLDPQRLYLSLYPAPESAYRVERRPEPFGATLRPGSTSMFGGVRLLNGYSPIRPSGVSREFDFAIHGEIRPDIGNEVLEHGCGPGGILDRLGVDGIIVASEVAGDPRPEAAWELAMATKEGRVFHRRGDRLSAIRSVNEINSRPNEAFVTAEVSRITEGRNRLEADVIVPPGERSALLTIARPFFGGYRATLGERVFEVSSYRGLMPVIELPAGARGRLTFVYRPGWLIWGGTIAAASLAAFLGSAVLAAVRLRSA